MHDVLHIALHVQGSEPWGKQPVEVEHVSGNTYLILCSPGLVEGIAAGDLIRLDNPELGTFSVVRRGGNISVKIAWPRGQNDKSRLDMIKTEMNDLGARLDGSIGHAAVFTIPVLVGFDRIETAFNRVAADIEGADWWYGNVYDDRGNPLGWWNQELDD